MEISKLESEYPKKATLYIDLTSSDFQSQKMVKDEFTLKLYDYVACH